MFILFLPDVALLERCRDYLLPVGPPPSGSIGARDERRRKAAAGQQALFRSPSSFSFGGGGGGGENLICCYIKGNFCSPDGTADHHGSGSGDLSERHKSKI